MHLVRRRRWWCTMMMMMMMMMMMLYCTMTLPCKQQLPITKTTHNKVSKMSEDGRKKRKIAHNNRQNNIRVYCTYIMYEHITKDYNFFFNWLHFVEFLKCWSSIISLQFTSQLFLVIFSDTFSRESLMPYCKICDSIWLVYLLTPEQFFSADFWENAFTTSWCLRTG